MRHGQVTRYSICCILLYGHPSHAMGILIYNEMQWEYHGKIISMHIHELYDIIWELYGNISGI